jgi:hypothetical protein
VKPGIFILRICGTRYIQSGTVESDIFILRNCRTRYIHPHELWNQVYSSSGTVDPVSSSLGTVQPGIFIPRKCETMYIQLFILKSSGTRYLLSQNCGAG